MTKIGVEGKSVWYVMVYLATCRPCAPVQGKTDRRSQLTLSPRIDKVSSCLSELRSSGLLTNDQRWSIDGLSPGLNAGWQRGDVLPCRRCNQAEAGYSIVALSSCHAGLKGKKRRRKNVEGRTRCTNKEVLVAPTRHCSFRRYKPFVIARIKDAAASTFVLGLIHLVVSRAQFAMSLTLTSSRSSLSSKRQNKLINLAKQYANPSSHANSPKLQRDTR
jgi:hypothetical protein